MGMRFSSQTQADRFGQLDMKTSEGLGIWRRREEERNEAASIGREPDRLLDNLRMMRRVARTVDKEG
jgi:hypothetical protein